VVIVVDLPGRRILVVVLFILNSHVGHKTASKIFKIVNCIVPTVFPTFLILKKNERRLISLCGLSDLFRFLCGPRRVRGK
jgi:hypothetical protein